MALELSKVALAESTIDELVELASAAADAAGKSILPHFRTRFLSIANKSTSAEFDPVTEADRAAEQAIRTLLMQHRPDDGIIGEEFGVSEGTSGFNWVLDPIDGTRAFIAGAPSWGVLISVEKDGRPVLGVIDQPFIGERWIGGLGKYEHISPFGVSELSTRPTTALSDAILMSTFPEIGTFQEREAFQAVAERTKLTRYGMDCYAYGLLALGQIDLVIEAGLQRYDISAPRAVVEAAGGIVTRWDGGNPDDGGRIIAAANAELHEQAIKLLTDSLGAHPPLS